MAIVKNWNGSWGLPDLGITEQIGSWMGSPNNYQGGSDITPAVSQPGASFQPAFITPQGYSAPGYIGGQPAGQVLTPQPAPTSTPTQNQNTGGGSLRDQFNAYRSGGGYGGWGEAEAWADYQARGGNMGSSGGGGNGQSDNSAQLDAIYNPLISTIQGQRDFINNQSLPNALAALATGRAQSERTVDEQYQQGQETLSQNQAALDRQKESAYDQARRDFMALQQQSRARFGGRGSAGMAATEIASKEFARQAGLGNISYTEGVQKLQNYASQLDRYSFEQKRKIDEDLATQEQQIRQNAQSQLLQILSDENSVKSAKAGSAFQLLQQYDLQIKNLASVRQQNLWQLEIWKQQQNDLLTKNFDLLKVPDLKLNSFTNTSGIAQTQPVSSPSYISSAGNNTDQYDELVNVFNS